MWLVGCPFACVDETISVATMLIECAVSLAVTVVPLAKILVSVFVNRAAIACDNRAVNGGSWSVADHVVYHPAILLGSDRHWGRRQCRAYHSSASKPDLSLLS